MYYIFMQKWCKKNYAINLCLLMAIFLSFVGCNPKPSNTKSIEAKPFEIVVLEVKTGGQVIKEKYNGDMDGLPVVLTKVENTHFSFMVPALPEGEAVLSFELGEFPFKILKADAVDIPQIIQSTDEIFTAALQDLESKQLTEEERQQMDDIIAIREDVLNSFNLLDQTRKNHIAQILKTNLNRLKGTQSASAPILNAGSFAQLDLALLSPGCDSNGLSEYEQLVCLASTTASSLEKAVQAGRGVLEVAEAAGSYFEGLSPRYSTTGVIAVLSGILPEVLEASFLAAGFVTKLAVMEFKPEEAEWTPPKNFYPNRLNDYSVEIIRRTLSINDGWINASYQSFISNFELFKANFSYMEGDFDFDIPDYTVASRTESLSGAEYITLSRFEYGSGPNPNLSFTEVGNLFKVNVTSEDDYNDFGLQVTVEKDGFRVQKNYSGRAVNRIYCPYYSAFNDGQCLCANENEKPYFIFFRSPEETYPSDYTCTPPLTAQVPYPQQPRLVGFSGTASQKCKTLTVGVSKFYAISIDVNINYDGGPYTGGVNYALHCAGPDSGENPDVPSAPRANWQGNGMSQSPDVILDGKCYDYKVYALTSDYSAVLWTSETLSSSYPLICEE